MPSNVVALLQVVCRTGSGDWYLHSFCRGLIHSSVVDICGTSCLLIARVHQSTSDIFFGYRSKMVARWTKKVGYRRFTYEPGSQIW
jgi:hypothetical protein